MFRNCKSTLFEKSTYVHDFVLEPYISFLFNQYQKSDEIDRIIILIDYLMIV